MDLGLSFFEPRLPVMRCSMNLGTMAVHTELWAIFGNESEDCRRVCWSVGVAMWVSPGLVRRIGNDAWVSWRRGSLLTFILRAMI